MFYSQFILAKKGPLGTIWIAAHLERKLRKNQVADTDIGVSVDSILFPDVPIALRLSSHLLLGVVRIYSKKVNYLFDDCSEALLKVKQAFRSTAVDLPPEQSKAPYHSITLPETFDLDDFELPDNEIFQGNFVDHHISTREQITLQDTMDGVAFPSSQFGPDERFGDGDASQIGLDLDEELFMDKGDAAGTSGILVDTDAVLKESAKESSPSKADERNEDVSDSPLASNTNYFNIQAPSTPGLTEEPNLPSAKEEIQVSDDHMDEDPTPCEVAAKEVAGTASSPMDMSHLGGGQFNFNGTFHRVDELENEKEQTLRNESMEFVSSGFAQPVTSNEHKEETKVQDSVGNILNSSSLENERIIAADVQSQGQCDVEEAGINGTAVPVPDNFVMEVQGCDHFAGCNKTELNGTYHPLHDSGVENNTSSMGAAVPGAVEAEISGSEPQNPVPSCLIVKTAETSESNVIEKLSGFAIPVLQACNSKLQHACDGAINAFDASHFQNQDNGLSSFGLSGLGDATNVSGISTNVSDEVEPTSKADQIAHEVTCAADSNLGVQLDNLLAEENHLDKENNLQSSDFPPPEILLFTPNLPAAGLADHFLADSTPGKEFVAKDGDATDENIISGRKRSFTESTLTIQSFNSVESSGGAQSKGAAEFIPDDNDLLSSILVGRSTAIKMKPTPPVLDTARAKRQRTAVRSVAPKRKVLVDDSTVLHGDTIRQQLTTTEDIRRVRKKAPCTNREVWVLQKQFLDDEIFSECVFTGIFPALQSLHSEGFNLNEIRIFRDDGNKEASEADISTRPTLVEESETMGNLIPCIDDVTTRPKLDEEMEALGTLVPSIAADEGLQEHGESLLETPCEQELTLVVDDSTLVKELDFVDKEVREQVLQNDVSGEKAGVVFDDERSSVCGDAIHPAISGTEPVFSVGQVAGVNCNSTDDIKVDSPFINNSSDIGIPMHTDVSGQILDQRCASQVTVVDTSTMEGISESGLQDQGVDGVVSEKVGLDERSDSDLLLEKTEGVDTNVVADHMQDTCSVPVHDSGISESIAHEESACRTSDQVDDGYHPDELGIANTDENFYVDPRLNGSGSTPNNASEDVKPDLSCSLEADLSTQITSLHEGETLQYWDGNQENVMESTSLPSEYVNTGNDAEFGTYAMEHDTDFLNFDDDDIAEDDESDMADPDEKRILDNSGWSVRTRAVANYLQVLFEKESDQANKVVSLENLLVGKTRREASRMFFETLVLKTKDYVQAEQEISFCDIKIKPRGKLLKSDY